MAEFNYTHFLRTFYGDIVERGQCEKLGDFIDKYVNFYLFILYATLFCLILNFVIINFIY